MSEHRRLAAIVAADVVGYSRLMGRDESGTLAALNAVRRDIVDPRVAAHGGRIVKTTGDGLLLEFPSVVDAVRCVVAVQSAMAEHNGDTPEDRRIVLRIGVNLGDIIIEGDDIFGDGVNVAARLQEIAPPGGVCVSSRVHDDIRDRLDATFQDDGERMLKNIARAVRVWRWIPGDPGRVRQAGADVPLALPDKPSIAVLPFQNMSGDPEQTYFADGIAEDIITALSRFKSLFVIARNSSFTYKDRAIDVRQVGRELGVRYVLEGSVRKAGGRVRITGQLIDCASGAHLWADRFDGSLEDVFDLQDLVTGKVVSAVAPSVARAEIERAGRKPVGNLDAYDCYLRGLAATYDMTRESWETALDRFREAVRLDPAFLTPHAMIARCHATRAAMGWIDRTTEEAETRRLALHLSANGHDDALALCWAGYGLVQVCHEHQAGATLIDRALSLNENLAIAWINRGYTSLYLGEHDAAIEQLTKALRLNPVDPESFRSDNGIANALFLLGRYHDAMTWATRALARHQTYLPAMRSLAAANALLGNIDDARRIIIAIRQVDPAMSISRVRRMLPHRQPQDMDRYMEALRLAGLPE